MDDALTVNWSVHPLNNFVYSITGHHQSVMEQDTIDIQALQNMTNKCQLLYASWIRIRCNTLGAIHLICLTNFF